MKPRTFGIPEGDRYMGWETAPSVSHEKAREMADDPDVHFWRVPEGGWPRGMTPNSVTEEWYEGRLVRWGFSI